MARVRVIGAGGSQDWSGIVRVFRQVFGPGYATVDGWLAGGNHITVGGKSLYLPVGRVELPAAVAVALIDSGCLATGAPDGSSFFVNGRGVRGNWVVWPQVWPPA